jgi:uncharacterized membrane protein
MMNEWQGVGHMAGMWLWWILGIVLIVLVVWVVVRLIPMRRGQAGSPQEQLKRRYAQGKIDREEYNARLDDLRR